MTEYSNRLKLLRVSIGLSKSEFGKKVGYSNQQISNYEKDKAPIPDRFINLLKEKYGENFGLPQQSGRVLYQQPPEKMLPEDKGGETRPGSYGLPDLSAHNVQKLILEVTPIESVMLNSFRQLDKIDQKGLYLTIMNLLHTMEQDKQTKKDRNKKDFLKNCIRELAKAVYQAE